MHKYTFVAYMRSTSMVLSEQLFVLVENEQNTQSLIQPLASTRASPTPFDGIIFVLLLPLSQLCKHCSQCRCDKRYVFFLQFFFLGFTGLFQAFLFISFFVGSPTDHTSRHTSFGSKMSGTISAKLNAHINPTWIAMTISFREARGWCCSLICQRVAPPLCKIAHFLACKRENSCLPAMKVWN